MRKIILNNNQIYYANKIFKQGQDIKLVNANQLIDGEEIEMGNLLFPSLESFTIEDGKGFDKPIDKFENLNQAITELSMIISMQVGE